MPLISVDEEDTFHLRVALESYLSDLRMEIARTDRREYREMLRHRQHALERFLAQLLPEEQPAIQP